MTNLACLRALRLIVFAVGCLAVLAPVPAAAQATRTWVSGVGDDVNPCSRTAPCKTWAGAISKTAAGGEIDALDPASFGTVTITKAMTLDGNGNLAAILSSSTNGIIVNAGAGDHVVLRNLTINGANETVGPGVNGVRFLAGQTLTIENCVIANFNTYGIDHTSPGNLVLHDTIIRNVVQGAIHVAPTSGTPKVMIMSSRLEDGAFGLQLLGGIATVRNSHASLHGGPGFWADGDVDMALDDVTSSLNDVGVRASNGADVRIGHMTVFGNATGGLVEETGGTITPFSGNLVAGNPSTASNTCDMTLQNPVVSCADATCPQPSCPQPPAVSVTINRTLGPCKKCKTKGGTTTCTGCPVNLQ
jgi:hypothetical protein